jgi:hypothetical protein
LEKELKDQYIQAFEDERKLLSMNKEGKKIFVSELYTMGAQMP